MRYFCYLGHWPRTPWRDACKPGSTTRPEYRKLEHSHPFPGFEYVFLVEVDSAETMRSMELSILKYTREYNGGEFMQGLEEFYHEMRRGDPEKMASVILSFIGKRYNYKMVDPSTLPKIERDYTEKQRAMDNHEYPNMKILNNNCQHQIVPDLRGYQVEAYEKIKEWMLGDDVAAYLEVYCGGGKTILYQQLFFDCQYAFDCVIVIEPGIPLMEDMHERWADLISETGWDFLYISSGNCGTTDRKKIEEACMSQKLFVCTTIDSFMLIDPALSYKNILLLGDEAHKLCGDKTELPWLLGHPNAKNVKKQLFATATPRMGSAEALRNDWVVMNNPKYFGKRIVLDRPASLRRLMDEEFLCPYEVVLGAVPNVRLKNMVGNPNYHASAMLLRSALQMENPPRKVLMYVNTINGVRSVYNIVRDMEVEAFFADSGRSARENALAAKQFEECDEPAVLVNCRMYSEGINIPSLDTVMFCDPKQALSEILQIIGRPLRFWEGNPNKLARIFVPYLVNAEYSDKERFEKILRIVQTISTQDEMLRDELTVKRKKDGINAGRRQILRHITVGGKFDVDPVVINYLKREMAPCLTMNDAIMLVLGDNEPREARQVWDEICQRGLWKSDSKTPWATCNTQCQYLVKKGILKRMGKPYQYYVEKAIKMTKEQFAAALKGMGITTQHDYHQTVEYSEEYPFNPEVVYGGFSWDMLIEGAYYGREETIQVLKKLSREMPKKFMTDQEKIEWLRGLDPKVHPNLRSFGPLADLNKKIFGTGRR